jgi:hypothetical protein
MGIAQLGRYEKTLRVKHANHVSAEVDPLSKKGHVDPKQGKLRIPAVSPNLQANRRSIDRVPSQRRS